MKKLCLILSMLGAAVTVHAADPLNGTLWKTIDDETNQPKALVRFSEQKDGMLLGTIEKILVPGEDGPCEGCEGPYHNKPLKGVSIVHHLKSIGGGQYANGEITDPKNGKTYSLKGEILNQGKTLKLRGYLGISLLGRNQIWQRVQ
ncbi:DUF2147 domain-containing protein [Acinetobacter pollinis]|uniref:DUF2147 domain-containing protein n=1 Tax=Acinetobacter pollinis TaxID=2605270 RepID=UPI0018A2A379|nr:DUF2147 domain-containing protein [Acinetobacter pollinis]MBF7690637.1 DUF2147 domain-containing protein [Acinetobacter pollinis]MBF7693348.1 DUF2147 domain-containing protein [Acinetobacter pollinis]MBF7698172.1 DUF2147 domain-containing protein [Acinetobacter pollinis]MBF7701203.1 DUF2147 domain-containing protein [Acinetobacter pollinis]